MIRILKERAAEPDVKTDRNNFLSLELSTSMYTENIKSIILVIFCMNGYIAGIIVVKHEM